MSTSTKSSNLQEALQGATDALRRTQTVDRQLRLPKERRDEIDIVVKNVLRNDIHVVALNEAQQQLASVDQRYSNREFMLRELLPKILG